MLESNLTAIADFRVSSPVTKFVRLRVPDYARTSLLPKAVALYVTVDGEVGVVKSVSEASSRTLHYITTKMCTDVPHQAGLHPRHFTAALRKDVTPVTKVRMIDGVLCDEFVKLNNADRAAVVATVGTKVERVTGILTVIADETRFF